MENYIHICVKFIIGNEGLPKKINHNTIVDFSLNSNGWQDGVAFELWKVQNIKIF